MSSATSGHERLRIVDASYYSKDGRDVLHLAVGRPNREQYRIGLLLRGSGAAGPIKRNRIAVAALLEELNTPPHPSGEALIKALRGKFFLGSVIGMGTAHPGIVLASMPRPPAVSDMDGLDAPGTWV